MRKFPEGDQRADWGVKPRACIDLQTPAEAAIREAIRLTEMVGADPMLTGVVIRLGQALDELGAYIDEVQP